MQKVARSCLLILLFFFGAAAHSEAQHDTVASVIKALQSLQSPARFDSAQFVNEVLRMYKADITDVDIDALHTVAKGFAKGSDRDKELFIHYYILTSLSRKEFYKAIDYAKQNISYFENNRGPHSKLLLQSFISLLRSPYRNSDKIGEGFLFYNQLLTKSRLSGDKAGEVNANYVLSGFYRTVGLTDVAIYHAKKALKLVDSAEQVPDPYFGLQSGLIGINGWINCTGILGDLYNLKEDYTTALIYSKAVLRMPLTNSFQKTVAPYQLRNVAFSFLGLNKTDSAAFYLNEAEKIRIASDVQRFVTILQTRSLLYLQEGNLAAADSVIKKCWELVNARKMPAVTPSGDIRPDYYLAQLNIARNRFAEAAILLQNDLQRMKGVRTDMLQDYKLLGETYDKIGDQQKAKAAFASYIRLQDSILADQSRFRTLSFEMEEQLAENGKAIDQLQTDNRFSRVLWMFSLGIALLLVIVLVLINQRYRVKRKANTVLEKTLTELKNTQSQLIQSEKMASLGELTAGIAHEIQNPLNFVNNFSEVNKELLTELNDEIDKGNYEDVKLIARDISNNEDKINHHGKRADAIVKGMLQHSRSSNGVKEPTDINALADEYLRLAYHGLRAKDKSFNATMKTDFDESIGTVNIISQDIGRVILNLITNAFYAVADKKKKGIEGYEPIVTVTTKKNGNRVMVSVRDNGMGIPGKVKEKIFQPFFTTKPTGEGTGLGLSMSYDIITKGHGGELSVTTQEGEYAEFTILLPL